MTSVHQSRFSTIPLPAIGRELKREDINVGHVRLYLEDHRGCLRLILINDARCHQYHVLSEQVLRRDFGASYQEIGFESMDGYTKMTNLDPYNAWPPALYPEGAPVQPADQPTSGRQIDGLRELAELTPTSIADAWI